MGSDYPNVHRSDKHFKAAGLSDDLKTQVGFWVRVFCREHVLRGWKLPMVSDYPTLCKLKVGQRLGWFCREPVFSRWKMPSGSDDPTRRIWSVGVMVRWMIRDVAVEFKISLLHRMIRRMVWRPSDKQVGQMTSAKVATGNGYCENRNVVGWSDALISEHIGLSDAYAEKDSNGSKRLDQVGGLYKRLTPAIFKLVEFRETLYTLKNTSKPTQVLSYQILSTPLRMLVLG